MFKKHHFGSGGGQAGGTPTTSENSENGSFGLEQRERPHPGRKPIETDRYKRSSKGAPIPQVRTPGGAFDEVRLWWVIERGRFLVASLS
jgi:hypothetical protein